MDEVKVRLSMEVPGATMLSSQDCEKMSKKKEAYDHTTIVLEQKVKKGKKCIIKKETFHINTRKSKPARRVLLISKKAYSFMTDASEIPATRLLKSWKSMTAAQRLEYHLSLIAESFNASSFSYEILDD